MPSPNLQTLTVPEVSQILGIHRVQCYKLVKEKKIPSIRLGKSIRIREAALLQWMNNQEHESQGDN